MISALLTLCFCASLLSLSIALGDNLTESVFVLFSVLSNLSFMHLFEMSVISNATQIVLHKATQCDIMRHACYNLFQGVYDTS